MADKIFLKNKDVKDIRAAGLEPETPREAVALDDTTINNPERVRAVLRLKAELEAAGVRRMTEFKDRLNAGSLAHDLSPQELKNDMWRLSHSHLLLIDREPQFYRAVRMELKAARDKISNIINNDRFSITEQAGFVYLYLVLCSLENASDGDYINLSDLRREVQLAFTASGNQQISIHFSSDLFDSALDRVWNFCESNGATQLFRGVEFRRERTPGLRVESEEDEPVREEVVDMIFTRRFRMPDFARDVQNSFGGTEHYDNLVFKLSEILNLENQTQIPKLKIQSKDSVQKKGKPDKSPQEKKIEFSKDESTQRWLVQMVDTILMHEVSLRGKCEAELRGLRQLQDAMVRRGGAPEAKVINIVRYLSAAVQEDRKTGIEKKLFFDAGDTIDTLLDKFSVVIAFSNRESAYRCAEGVVADGRGFPYWTQRREQMWLQLQQHQTFQAYFTEKSRGRVRIEDLSINDIAVLGYDGNGEGLKGDNTKRLYRSSDFLPDRVEIPRLQIPIGLEIVSNSLSLKVKPSYKSVCLLREALETSARADISTGDLVLMLQEWGFGMSTIQTYLDALTQHSSESVLESFLEELRLTYQLYVFGQEQDLENRYANLRNPAQVVFSILNAPELPQNLFYYRKQVQCGSLSGRVTIGLLQRANVRIPERCSDPNAAMPYPDDVYRMLLKFNLLSESQACNKLLEFVNLSEKGNLYSRHIEADLSQSRVFLAFAHRLTFDKLIMFYQSGRDVNVPLEEDVLRELGLLEASNAEAEHRNNCAAAFRQLEADGYVLRRGNGEKILLDVPQSADQSGYRFRFPGGYTEAHQLGADVMIRYIENVSISIIPKEALPAVFYNREGLRVNGREVVINRLNDKLAISLQELLVGFEVAAPGANLQFLLSREERIIVQSVERKIATLEARIGLPIRERLTAGPRNFTLQDLERRKQQLELREAREKLARSERRFLKAGKHRKAQTENEMNEAADAYSRKKAEVTGNVLLEALNEEEELIKNRIEERIRQKPAVLRPFVRAWYRAGDLSAANMFSRPLRGRLSYSIARSLNVRQFVYSLAAGATFLFMPFGAIGAAALRGTVSARAIYESLEIAAHAEVKRVELQKIGQGREQRLVVPDTVPVKDILAVMRVKQAESYIRGDGNIFLRDPEYVACKNAIQQRSEYNEARDILTERLFRSELEIMAAEHETAFRKNGFLLFQSGSLAKREEPKAFGVLGRKARIASSVLLGAGMAGLGAWLRWGKEAVVETVKIGPKEVVKNTLQKKAESTVVAATRKTQEAVSDGGVIPQTTKVGQKVMETHAVSEPVLQDTTSAQEAGRVIAKDVFFNKLSEGFEKTRRAAVILGVGVEEMSPLPGVALDADQLLAEVVKEYDLLSDMANKAVNKPIKHQEALRDFIKNYVMQRTQLLYEAGVSAGDAAVHDARLAFLYRASEAVLKQSEKNFAEFMDNWAGLSPMEFSVIKDSRLALLFKIKTTDTDIATNKIQKLQQLVLGCLRQIPDRQQQSIFRSSMSIGDFLRSNLIQRSATRAGVLLQTV